MNDWGVQCVSVARFAPFCRDQVAHSDGQKGWNLVETERGVRGPLGLCLASKEAEHNIATEHKTESHSRPYSLPSPSAGQLEKKN